MPRILGIDPGSRVTGYGVIEAEGSRVAYVASGCVRVKGDDLGERLRQIFVGIQEVIGEYRPAETAVEAVFLAHNPSSAIKLGQARGSAICAAAHLELPVSEYTPRQVKQAVVGTGAASKDQVQHMVKVLLQLSGTLQEDAADALAVALCHAHTGHTLKNIPNARRMAAGRLR